MATIPTCAEEFTLDWFNEVLKDRLQGASVTRAEVTDSQTPGQTSEIAVIDLAYDAADAPVPTRLIGKYASKLPIVIEQVAKVYGLYWRETSRYLDIPEVGLPSPTCYYSDFDPGTQAFVILMNDLSPATSPSWASTPEQVAEAVSHLPAFHARWWNDEFLRSKDWLVQYDNRDFFAASSGAAYAAIPRLRELFGEHGEHTASVLEPWCTRQDDMAAYFSAKPFTYVHGDYHPKQMFFASERGGEFGIIDWQFSFVAQGAWDLARIIALGQDVESRRATERALIEGYHAGLLRHGVKDYSLGDLEDDFRVGLVVNQQIMAIALVDTDIGLIEKECAGLGLDWKDVMIQRGEAAVRDWDVLDFVNSI
ncbi:MAG: phosphotransferase [Pseudomonadales bacterium]|nr:phosphotransferase [Pseudomonadales bacterium]